MKPVFFFSIQVQRLQEFDRFQVCNLKKSENQQAPFLMHYMGEMMSLKANIDKLAFLTLL